jgi:hypothetical protein
MLRTLARLASGATALLALPALAAGQHVHDGASVAPSRIRASFGAHAVPLLTHVSPILAGESRTEAYLTQPTLFGQLSLLDGALHVRSTLSLEALTLERGELGAGAYGEGYVDRRHPHTYLHELMMSATTSVTGVRGSLSAGRGFVPFGTDDPMMRPFVKFPVNHHLGQILERLVLAAGARAGPFTVEAALFNGNEPADPEDLGSIDRFADSWAARVTVQALTGVEVQASHAWVESPELPAGGGWDQRKWSASARLERDIPAGGLYALAEWKRTTQVSGGRDVFSFGSVLLEAALDVSGWRPALRLERSDRPEEERLSDPFRTHWPHGGGHVLGITRWNIVGVRIERAFTYRTLTVAPFVEASFAHVDDAVRGPFDAAELYGSRDIRTINIGARLRVGMHPARMGRYGVAAADEQAH